MLHKRDMIPSSLCTCLFLKLFTFIYAFFFSLSFFVYQITKLKSKVLELAHWEENHYTHAQNQAF